MPFARLFLVLSVLFAPFAAPAAADDDLAALVQGLAARSYSAKIKVVNLIAATGAPAAAGILRAYLARKLYKRKSDGVVVLVEASGGTVTAKNPVTKAVIGTLAKRKLKKLRLNNRLRRAIRTALGGLTLASRDPAQRIKAANAVFKAPRRSHIAVLEKALASETDDAVKSAFARALAAARLSYGKTAEIRIRAVGVLAAYPDAEVGARLRRLMAGTAETDAKVRAAARAAIADIEKRNALWEFAARVFQGLSLGSVLLLAAIGLAITFGVMGVINMAHGEMVMLGAYTTFVIQEVIRTSAPGLFDLSLAFAIPAAFLVAGGFGVAIERGIIRFLYGRPLETLLATWGLSLVLQQLVRSVFGPTNREVGNPSWMTGAIELQGGALLTYNRIWIIVFSLLVVGALALLLKKTSFGLRMRAVTQNRRMASAMGIRTGWIDAMTFGLGSGIAGMAGVALSQIDNVSPNLGQAYIVDSFMVVVFGGVGNLLGTLFGAVSIGIANKFLEAWSGAVLAKILVLIAVILFIQKRPRGMFALKGRAADA